ncbi:DUF2867 domain-containing protein [Streptomyces lydicus]
MRAIRDVHSREVPAPAEAVGVLLDRLGRGEDDPLFPTPAWPPVRFDRPLAVGADGGHAFVRYRVSAYEPGRRIRFDFTAGDGWHEFRVRPLGPGSCRVEHVLESRPSPVAALRWLLGIRLVHGAVVEEVFDNIERAAAGRPLPPARRSARVRLLSRLLWDRPRAVPLPATARLAHDAFPRTDFQDAWQLELRPGMPQEPEAWQGVLGRSGFPVLGRTEHEILLGKDARHLDFRASVQVADGRVTLGTVVRIHRTAGRLYFAVVRRFHPFLARAMLRRCHRRLALAAPSAGEREAARA